MCSLSVNVQKSFAMEHIIIACPHGGQIYAFCYILACLAGMGIFIVSAVKSGYPLHKVLLIASGATLFFLIGTKLLALSPKDLGSILGGDLCPEDGRKTILGGLAGLLVAGLFIARWIKTSYRIFDYLAVGLPIGMAVNRIGCFFAGCCYGKPSDLPWAVTYTQHSHAFQSQLSGGLVHPQDLLALPVHPVQLYDMIACLLIAWAVWSTRHTWKAAGSQLLMAVKLYACARFVIEFFRDPVTDPYTSGLWMGIKTVQWLMILAIAVLGAIFYIRERKCQQRTTQAGTVKMTGRREVALLLFLVFTSIVVHPLLDIFEQTILLVIMLPAVLATGIRTLEHVFQSGFIWKTALITAGCFILMSQTYIPADNTVKVRYFEGGLAGIFGQYRDFTGKAYKGTDCEGDTYYDFENIQYRKYDYKLMGMNLSYNERLGPYNRFSFKISAYAGKENGEVLDSGVYFSNKIYTINPGISYNWRYLGFDLGFHAGSFTFAHFQGPTNRLGRYVYKHYDNLEPRHSFNFMPQVGLRIGPQNIIYVEGQFCNAFPMSSPLMKFSAGFGTGLGKWDGTNLGVGFCPAGFYINSTIPIKDRYVVYCLLTDNFQGGSASRYNISFAFSYRFGYKQETSNPKVTE
jgi:prolipoprotein diacylglyceryltransferase